MADGAKYGSSEHFSLFSRSVSENNEVNESKLKIEKFIGKPSSENWLKWIVSVGEEFEFDFKKCSSVTFDGASTMISEEGGLSGKITNWLSTKGFLVDLFQSNYCFSHRLSKAVEKINEIVEVAIIKKYLYKLTTDNLKSIETITFTSTLEDENFVAILYFVDYIITKIKVVSDWLQKRNLSFSIAYRRIIDLIIFLIDFKTQINDSEDNALFSLPFLNRVSLSERSGVRQVCYSIVNRLVQALSVRFSNPTGKIKEEYLKLNGFAKENELSINSLDDFTKLGEKVRKPEFMIALNSCFLPEYEKVKQNISSELNMEITRFNEWKRNNQQIMINLQIVNNQQIECEKQIILNYCKFQRRKVDGKKELFKNENSKILAAEIQNSREQRAIQLKETFIITHNVTSFLVFSQMSESDLALFPLLLDYSQKVEALNVTSCTVE
ncbi:hypothetical protein EIN_256120, partial [Entamoeba invadens IP1]